MNFNRKLSKYLKSFEHVHYIEVKYDRKCHTRHGLHLNARAKELVTFIKVQPNRSEQTVLPLHWKKTQRQDGIKKCKNRERITSEEHLAISSVETNSRVKHIHM
jgi:adenosine deaminase